MAMAVRAGCREYGSVTHVPTVMREVWCATSVREPYTSRKNRSSASQK